MTAVSDRTRVLIAGVGGASLGTEIAKSLRLVDRYQIFGADISPTAFGLYDDNFDATFLVRRENYIADIVDVCKTCEAEFIIAGGEQPMTLLGAASAQLETAGVRLLGNSPELVLAYSDKKETFDRLNAAGIEIPKTMVADQDGAFDFVGLPCIVKPATGSGGSASVFFATSIDEALTYAAFIRRGGAVPLAQEYIDATSGEFTVGVLSLPSTDVVGSIALRRSLDAKLSVSYRGRGGLISSGYSQGHIGDYPEVRQQAEQIAKVIQSRGPINVQGRLKNGTFVPFEINPRFSASSYLRALAGFNEIDILIRHAQEGAVPVIPPIRFGWYLRSLTEKFVEDGEMTHKTPA